MYSISRLLLITGVVAGAYCAAIATVVCWPASGLFIGLFLVAHLYQKKRSGHLTTLGSARWAERVELQRAGMLDADSGLILGRLPYASAPQEPRFSSLFARNVTSAEACQRFWNSSPRKQAGLVRLPRAIHTAVFSPSGGGKGVSGVIPFLFNCRDSCVVVDFKGENARLTADYRRRVFGQQIIMLDLYRLVTQKPDRFNPLVDTKKDSPTAIDDCNDFAKALVSRSGEEREPHWNDSAEAWIATVLATIVRYGGEETRSLQTAREILSNPQRLDMAVRLACESDAWGGMLARMGGQLTYFAEKEKSSVLTTVGRHLRFLDSLAVAESTRASSFDPAKLREGKMTVYLILPPEHMRAQAALLRVWISSLLRAVVRGGLQEKNKVHFILDEAASLGHLEAIDDAVDKYRGYGVRLQFYFQSMGQLKKCFPDGQEQTLLSNATQVFFGVNDNQTAEFVSARLGESTIIVESGGRSSGNSSNWSSSQQGAQHGSGGSDGSTSNWAQQARKLLKPEEVLTLDPRLAITFTPNVPPILTRLSRYYEEPKLGRRPGWIKRLSTACCILLASIGFCALTLGAAAILTLEINDKMRARQGIQVIPERAFSVFEHP